MSTDDLKAHAASNQDFYGLLDISPAANESEIRRAYRKTALKYHPDKIANPTPADIDKFHVLQIAYDVLSDASVRQLYDNAREARMRKQRERDMMDAAKRKMREDLEARERAGAAARGGVQQGVKRPWMPGSEEDTEEKLQREIERIAEAGRQRRKDMADRAKREVEEAERQKQQAEEEALKSTHRASQRVDLSQEGGTNVPELDRSVRVRWVRAGREEELGKDWLEGLFAQFGPIEATFMMKDKRARVEGQSRKITLATGVVVFKSIVNAHAAVSDSKMKMAETAGEWMRINSVEWASGKPLNLQSNNVSTPPTESSASSKESKEPRPTQPASSQVDKKPAFSFPGLHSAPTTGKTPSFGSFSTGPKASSDSSGKTSGGPTYQEMLMMRLKNAQREKEERKALEEQLAREDAAADAAEMRTNDS
ncbi:hypothetical protein N7462_004587 [Penicillium macrosclerotiorum]|uniref:uncharacterized protein n=1 Tax=Penicillium macrosclerotiorum TaxID=303699 RepID=UPI002547694E|nr:uncharacterized protein N7462_004587 [Penicillium macrosclerotiorum]KAJ5690195.1 hypothetical protein N7462_004587 [Penicillium macrosclerotiorum]